MGMAPSNPIFVCLKRNSLSYASCKVEVASYVLVTNKRRLDVYWCYLIWAYITSYEGERVTAVIRILSLFWCMWSRQSEGPSQKECPLPPWWGKSLYCMYGGRAQIFPLKNLPCHSLAPHSPFSRSVVTPLVFCTRKLRDFREILEILQPKWDCSFVTMCVSKIVLYECSR